MEPQASGLFEECCKHVVAKHCLLPITNKHYACSDGAICCMVLEWQEDVATASHEEGQGAGTSM